MKKIDVHFSGYDHDWHVGTLADSGGRLLFEYSGEAIRRGVELSPIKLRLQSESYKDFPVYQQRLPGLFADCLPDGWGLLLMDRLFTKRGLDIRTISPLDRLAFIGNNAIGALSFRPSSEEELTPADVDLAALANEIVLLVEDGEDNALKKLALMGGSPQGARPKVLVQYDQSTKFISNSPLAKGSPWLVKFQARGEPKEVCAIEQAYAHMASLCNLAMPKTEYFDLDKDLAGFGIERFDRKNGFRVPTITLAGLMDVDFRIPGISYEAFLRVTRLVTRSEAEVKKAFGRCVFNVVFNNRDDHSKNFSYRMNERLDWELAPAYNLTFNHGPGGVHQMDICGEGRRPTIHDLLKLAEKIDLRKADAMAMIEHTTSVAGTLAREIRNFKVTRKTSQEIIRVVDGNRDRMVQSGRV